ncbi:hypothetical protein ABGB17_29250 [Sphaerisporangium sp. B11E5]|uniref:hypothetical protein n=1 Tax=Sphaerisporangium sp. B11E5 TaxID=3153563 RepID=UPI00325DD56B
MNANELIESYISDVARLLPRTQRADVARELRTLLHDELSDRAAEAGHDPDERTAHDMLIAFGRPAEVAARYRPAHPIIDPADTRRFLRVTVIGMAVIWLLGLLDVLRRHPAGSLDDALIVLQSWWLGVAIPSLWWPGVVLLFFALAAWTRRRRPSRATWKPRPADRDHINRPARTAALIFFVCGTLVLLDPPAALDLVTGGRLPVNPLTYDDDFYHHRAPWLLTAMVLHLALFAVLIVHGRWRPSTRRIDIAMNLVICGLLTWILLAGDIFTARPADQITKTVIVLIVLTALVDVAQKLRRERRRVSYATPLPRLRGGS